MNRMNKNHRMKEGKWKSFIPAFLFILLLAFFLPSSLAAQTLTDQGYSAEQISGADGFLRWEVTDAEGSTFIYSGPSLPEGETAETVIKMVTAVRSFKNITPTTITVLQGKNRIEMNVQTEAVVWGDVDLQQYFPSGLLFYWEERLEYSFRIFVDGFLLRLQGGFQTEDGLLDKVALAIEDPQQFVQNQNPEYFARVLNELDKELQLSREETEAYRQSMEEYRAEVAALDAKFTEALAALQSETDAISTQQQRLLQAVHVLNNKGLFGSMKPFNEAAVTQILEWKAENPALTMDEVKDKLKAADIKASGNEIALTFALFYNEY